MGPLVVRVKNVTEWENEQKGEKKREVISNLPSLFRNLILPLFVFQDRWIKPLSHPSEIYNWQDSGESENRHVE